MNRLTALLMVAVLVLGATACETQPKRRKAVPPPADMSGLPWNRPTKAEGAGRFGSMVPQSR